MGGGNAACFKGQETLIRPAKKVTYDFSQFIGIIKVTNFKNEELVLLNNLLILHQQFVKNGV